VNMDRFDAGQVVTVFRSRLRPEHADSYGDLAPHIASLARGMPGLVDLKTFSAEDGERVTIATFADMASHDGWREHSEHRVAQKRGRSEFYAEYTIQVCQTLKARRFVAGSGSE
jgi:heme-degrading monooxygenase HmoA